MDRLSPQGRRRTRTGRWADGRLGWGASALALAGVGLVMGSCAGPLDALREREGDLAPRLSARSLAVRALDTSAMTRAPGASPASPSSTTHTPDGTTLSWSLPEALALAIEHNLDLRAALFDPRIEAARLDAERAKFEAVFTPSVRYAYNDPATFNTTQGSLSQGLSVDNSVSVPLRTGGRASVGLNAGYNQTSNPFITRSESYDAQATASISQPLLRGQGRGVNTASIKIAGYRADIAQLRTKLELVATLAGVERAYWRLVAARGELDVRQRQLELAQQQLARAQRRVDAGDAAEIEVTRARSGIAQRLGAIIAAETGVTTSQRALKRSVGAPQAPVDSTMTLVPATVPEAVPLELEPRRLTGLAIENRGELLEGELQLLADALEIDLAKDATLPAINAQGQYSFDGIGTRVPGATRTLVRGRFQSWNLGLSGEFPLDGNQAAQANWRAVVLTRLQRISTNLARRQSVEQDVLDAIDRVNSAWQQILASQQSAILAGQTLDAEQRQFDAGLRTSTDVLDAAATLAEAQSSEVRALSDYRLALVDLAVATGTVLGAADVQFEDLPDPNAIGLEAPSSGFVPTGRDPATREPGYRPRVEPAGY
jgi:HAE1 family hydrophobic/amphiphilic exporter-1